jgi:RNA polymerase sigma factor (sigma-70 family)
MCARVLSKGGWPAEEKPTLSWLFTAAFNTCIDFLRVRKRIRAHEVSIDDQDFPIETGDAEEAGHLKRYVAKQVVEKPAIARNVAILSDYVDGMEARDIAKKYGIKIGNVYQRKEKALEILRSGWLQVPAAAAVGFVILFLLINRIPRDNTVTSSHEHAAPNAPLLRLPPHPDPAELRRAALTECHVNEYEWCLKNLNHARRLDPAGETDPELIAARKDAEARMKERWDKKEH